jgi:hypothetical protein
MISDDLREAVNELSGDTGQTIAINAVTYPAIVTAPMFENVFEPGIELEGVKYTVRVSKQYLTSNPGIQTDLIYKGNDYRITKVTDAGSSYLLELKDAGNAGK